MYVVLFGFELIVFYVVCFDLIWIVCCASIAFDNMLLYCVACCFLLFCLILRELFVGLYCMLHYLIVFIVWYCMVLCFCWIDLIWIDVIALLHFIVVYCMLLPFVVVCWFDLIRLAVIVSYCMYSSLVAFCCGLCNLTWFGLFCFVVLLLHL